VADYADDRYSHPLGERYASREMQAVFAPANRYGTWRRLWLALAEAEKELGLPIGDDAIDEMRRGLDDIDLEKAAEYEKRFRHDVMAHVHLFGDTAPAARGIIHLGATSAFIGDNTDLILHREALTLIRDRLIRCIARLSNFAAEHRDLPTLAFTHFQPAQPTTVGKRATLWLQDFLLDIQEMDFRLETLRFRGAKGTTGTQASFLELFDGDHDKVDALDLAVARRMGFTESYGVTGQTYTRKIDAQILGTLAGVASSASKMGNDLRLLANVREVEEPFEEEQIGSSAMPYKRNPMRSERICGIARHVIALSQEPLITHATQWLERTLDDSANRRLSIPDSFLALDGILVLVENVVSGLVVNAGVIQRNLEEHLPFMASETILMRAVSAGGDRQDLHERIRQHAMAAASRMKEEGGSADLLERIADDDAFGMQLSELREIIDPAQFVGRAPQQVDRFLAEWVQPALERLESDANQRLGEPDVRV
jgi:adenylosuccinate lyase